MEKSQQGQQNQLQVKVSDKILKGVYSNMVQIGHTREEFVLDFMNVYPPAGTLNSRVIMSPSHIKRVLTAIEDNIKKYEAQFAKIEAVQAPQHTVGFRIE